MRCRTPSTLSRSRSNVSRADVAVGHPISQGFAEPGERNAVNFVAEQLAERFVEFAAKGRNLVLNAIKLALGFVASAARQGCRLVLPGDQHFPVCSQTVVADWGWAECGDTIAGRVELAAKVRELALRITKGCGRGRICLLSGRLSLLGGAKSVGKGLRFVQKPFAVVFAGCLLQLDRQSITALGCFAALTFNPCMLGLSFLLNFDGSCVSLVVSVPLRGLCCLDNLGLRNVHDFLEAKRLVS